MRARGKFPWRWNLNQPQVLRLIQFRNKVSTVDGSLPRLQQEQTRTGRETEHLRTDASCPTCIPQFGQRSSELKTSVLKEKFFHPFYARISRQGDLTCKELLDEIKWSVVHLMIWKCPCSDCCQTRLMRSENCFCYDSWSLGTTFEKTFSWASCCTGFQSATSSESRRDPLEIL